MEEKNTKEEFIVPEGKAYDWVRPENQERLLRMISRTYFSIYTFFTYMSRIIDTDSYKHEVKRCYTRCRKWCERFESDVKKEFPMLDAVELFLDTDDDFRTKPVSNGSNTTVRQYMEQMHNRWFNELGKQIHSSDVVDLLAYGEAVRLHVIICCIINGTEINNNPCLKIYNRMGGPAVPLICESDEQKYEQVYPNSVCNLLSSHHRLINALYKYYHIERTSCLKKLSEKFVCDIDTILLTLVELYTRSNVFDVDFEKYRKKISDKTYYRYVLEHCKRCNNDRTW